MLVLQWQSGHLAVCIRGGCIINVTRRTVYLWSEGNFSLIKQTVLELYQQHLATNSALTPVDIVWNDFMSIFNTCILHVPTKLTTAKHHQPWINGHIKCLTRKKQRAYSWAHSTNSAPEYSDIKKQCQYEFRKYFNQYVSTLIDPDSNVVTKKIVVIY